MHLLSLSLALCLLRSVTAYEQQSAEKQARLAAKEGWSKLCGMQLASMSTQQLRGQYRPVGERGEEVWHTVRGKISLDDFWVGDWLAGWLAGRRSWLVGRLAGWPLGWVSACLLDSLAIYLPPRCGFVLALICWIH